MSEHHPYGPSSLHRRIACPASYRMEQGRPEIDTGDAVAGNEAHEAAAAGDRTNDHAANFLDHIDSLRPDGGWQREDQEQRVNLYDRYGKVLLFGTLDHIGVGSDGIADISDLKTGWGYQAPAAENPQLMTYAAAAAQEYGLAGVRVYLHKSASNWTDDAYFSKAQLIEWRDYLAEMITHQATTDQYMLRPTDTGCKYCNARQVCPAIPIASGAIVERDQAALSVAELGQMIGTGKAVQRYIRDLEQLAKDTLDAGGDVPGWRLVHCKGKRECTDPGLLLQMLQSVGIDTADILPHVSVKLAKVEDIYKRHMKATQGGTLKAHLEQFKEGTAAITGRADPFVKLEAQ